MVAVLDYCEALGCTVTVKLPFPFPEAEKSFTQA